MFCSCKWLEKQHILYKIFLLEFFGKHWINKYKKQDKNKMVYFNIDFYLLYDRKTDYLKEAVKLMTFDF